MGTYIQTRMKLYGLVAKNVDKISNIDKDDLIEILIAFSFHLEELERQIKELRNKK